MFFFNGRIRNANIVPTFTLDRPHTNKTGYPSIILACLLVIIGLIFIFIGLISEIEKSTFFGVGITSFGFGFCLITVACFYTKLTICYHNWVYGAHITPTQLEPSTLATTGGISISYYTGPTSITQKVLRKTQSQSSTARPVNIFPNVEINRVIITPTIAISRTQQQQQR